MTKVIQYLVLIAVCGLPLQRTSGQQGQILPGEGVAGVKLGVTFDRFSKVFHPQPQYDEDFPGNACWNRSYHWVDTKAEATGVYSYFKAGKLAQISVQTPRFSLASGLKVGATVTQVVKAYPQGHWFILLHSGGTDVGGKDLVYWVARDSGIAFSFYWDRRQLKRLVLGIDIFRKNTEYRPEGCISPPQQWEPLKQGPR